MCTLFHVVSINKSSTLTPDQPKLGISCRLLQGRNGSYPSELFPSYSNFVINFVTKIHMKFVNVMGFFYIIFIKVVYVTLCVCYDMYRILISKELCQYSLPLVSIIILYIQWVLKRQSDYMTGSRSK